MVSAENLQSFVATVGGGFIGGLLLGYAIKKIIRIAAVIVGLFIAALVYLQHQHIASINWDRVEQLSRIAIASLTNSTIRIPSLDTGANTLVTSAIITDFGIPLTSSMASGFTIGFLKG